MTTLYRIEDVPVSLLEGCANWYLRQDLSVKILLAAAAPAALLAGAAVSVEAAPVAAAAALGLAGIAGLGNSDGPPAPITSLTSDEATSYSDSEGRPLGKGVLYASHPRKSATTLIPARSFQSVILREQQADLIDHIRSLVPARNITIRMKAEQSTAHAGTFLGNMFAGKQSEEWITLTDLTYDSPTLVQPHRDLLWLDRFPSVVAGLRGGSKGVARFHERMQQNVNLEATIASRVGFELGAMNAYELDVSVKW